MATVQKKRLLPRRISHCRFYLLEYNNTDLYNDAHDSDVHVIEANTY